MSEEAVLLIVARKVQRGQVHPSCGCVLATIGVLVRLYEANPASVVLEGGTKATYQRLRPGSVLGRKGYQGFSACATHVSIPQTVAVRLTGGGDGLPGTLKSMTAEHVFSLKAAITCHFSSLPYGAIVIESDPNVIACTTSTVETVSMRAYTGAHKRGCWASRAP